MEDADVMMRNNASEMIKEENQRVPLILNEVVNEGYVISESELIEE